MNEFGPAGASAGQPAAEHLAVQRALVARMLLVVPLIAGTLLAEGIFAARGDNGDAVSLPAAALAFALLWVGVAWALHSWVAILLTFVPAVLTTLGAGMVGGVEPAGGAALLIVGGTMMLAIMWSRVTNPARRWTPGWFNPASQDPASQDPASQDPASQDPASQGPASQGPASQDPAGQGPASNVISGFHPADDHLNYDEPAARTPPAWDTSATNRRTRDEFVAEQCRRGGAVGPVLVTLEEFFTGNGDPRSIAPTLRECVPFNDFRMVLHELRSRSDVTELFIQLEPLDAGEYPGGQWPTAGSVHVVGTIDPDELDAAIARLRPEPLIGPLPVDVLAGGAPAPTHAAEYAIWWG